MGYLTIEAWKRQSMFGRLGSEYGLSVKEIQGYCPFKSDDNAIFDLEITGGDTVLPIIRAWKDLYAIGCPMDICLEGGGSTNGAISICSSKDSSGYTDVGMMSRDFDPVTEAVPCADTQAPICGVNLMNNVVCGDVEIELVGDKRGEGIFIGFMETVLLDYVHGETVADNRPTPYEEVYGADALQYLLWANTGAVAFAGYHFYPAHKDLFWAAPLAQIAIGPFVEPSKTSIGDHTYPLTRGMLLVIRDNRDILNKVIPFVKFGYDNPELLWSTGYAAVDNDRAKEMILHLSNGPYVVSGSGTDSEEQGKSNVGLIMGILVACAVVVALAILRMKYFRQ